MTPTGFLSPEDLRRMTGRARANGQEEWLKSEGIPHRRQGSDMLVMWVHVEGWIEGRSTSALVEPDFSGLEKKQAEYEAKCAMWAAKRAQKEAAAKARPQKPAYGL